MLIDASNFIHNSIISLIDTTKDDNHDLLQIDLKFLKHLSFGIQRTQEECQTKLASRTKLLQFTPDQINLYNQLPIQAKVGILELKNNNQRVLALNFDHRYYPFFCRLKVNQRPIFCGADTLHVYQTFTQFTEEDWRAIILYTLRIIIINYDDEEEENEEENYLGNFY